MIAVDTNILLHAHRSESPWSKIADEKLADLAESGSWAIPWPCLHEFVGIATHARVFTPPSPLEDALSAVESWLASPTLVVLGETEMHWTSLRDVLKASRVIGPKIHDARIAALCIEHGVKEIWTADRDFSRFAGVKAVNPLVQP